MGTSAKKTTPGLSTNEVMVRLRKHFSGTAYAVLAEVADGIGYSQSRWADALTMSLWPSRGLELMGFEIKVSRSDWVKERDTPEKADAICRYCDRWYVVVGDASIVKDGELPSTWGMMVPTVDGLRIAKQAPELKPAPLDRAFVAAIMRRCAEQSVDENLLKTTELTAYRKGYENGEAARKRFESTTEKTQRELIEKLSRKIEKFQEETGISLDSYWDNFSDIKEVVRRHKAGMDAEEQMQRLYSAAAHVMHITKPVIAELDARKAVIS